MLLTKAADLSEEDIEVSKENIIDLKLDLLFGLRTEEQIASELASHNISGVELIQPGKVYEFSA